MERNEQYQNRMYNQSYSNRREESRPENYERYTDRGNYYGMPHHEDRYDNVSVRDGRDSGRFSPGPMGGYGANNYNKHYSSNQDNVHRNRDNHYRYGDDNHFRQSHGYSGQQDSQDRGFNKRDNYNYSPEYGSNYDVTGNRMYARQENSYQSQGRGRRFEDHGKDERYNYGHELTDIHHDRGPLERDSSQNDYNPQVRNRGFGEHDEDFRYSGEIRSTGNRNSNRDNYATGLYASNRSYVSDHSDSDGDRYSSRENRSRRSGPDYSKSSPISGYGYDTFGI